MSIVELVEHKSKSYAPRTYHNAHTADLTLALAVDFNTAGERLTKKAAGDKYLPIWYHTTALLAARELYKTCKRLEVRVLNIAGNGIYTLQEHGIDQDSANSRIYNILKLVHQHWPLKQVISGGQTGVDIAGLVAAHKLGINCVGTFPKGYLQRDFSGVDRSYSKEQIEADIVAFSSKLT